MPKSGEIVAGAQFEEAGFLAAGNLDGFEEAGLRSCPFRRRERKSPLDAVQVGKPETLAGLFYEGEGFS